MAASNTDDRDDDRPDEPAPPTDRSDDAGRDTSSRFPEPDEPPGELPDETVDERFADLVASLGDLGSGSPAPISYDDGRDGSAPAPQLPHGTGPQGTGSADDGPSGARDELPEERPTPPGDADGAVTRSAGPRDWPVTPEVEALEEEDSHFNPPDPGPLLSDKDPLLTMAWFAVGGIPVLALVSVVLAAAVPALAVPPLVGQVALGLFVAGLGVLLWRMPHRRDPEDDDPGAVV